MKGYVKQVGGEHYQAEYQHWDMVIDCGLHYLPACATKYVQRDKGDIAGDLGKALSYIEKAKGAEVRPIGEDVANVVIAKWGISTGMNLWQVALCYAIVQGQWDEATEFIELRLVELEHAAGNNPDR